MFRELLILRIDEVEFEVEVFELIFGDLGGGIGEGADGLLGFGKGNHVTDGVQTGQDHGETIEAKGNTSMGRRTILQGLQEKSELGPGLFWANSK